MTSGLWELVLKGVWVTIQLLVCSALLAAAVSFVVGVARTHRLWIVRFLAGFYTEVFRGTSALVMIFWVFFVLPPAFGWQLVPMWAGTLALGLTYGAYGSEIVRGALSAVDPAQKEGGIALSFTPWQRLRLILDSMTAPSPAMPINPPARARPRKQHRRRPRPQTRRKARFVTTTAPRQGMPTRKYARRLPPELPN